MATKKLHAKLDTYTAIFHNMLLKYLKFETINFYFGG